MRTSLFATVVKIAAAGQSLSSWVTDYEGMLAQVGCRNGPKDCRSPWDTDPNPVYCGSGEACFITEFGQFCTGVYDWQCYKECPEGQVLNPIHYCTCIDIEERYEMFCADDGPTDPIGEEGESCLADENCLEGLECRNHICSRPLGQKGDQCHLSSECDTGLFCLAH